MDLRYIFSELNGDVSIADGVSGGRFVPAVYPGALLLSARGRVTFSLMRGVTPPPSTAPFTAPEYRSQRAQRYVDADIEKVTQLFNNFIFLTFLVTLFRRIFNCSIKKFTILKFYQYLGNVLRSLFSDFSS